MIVLTFDVDWAPDPVIEDTLSLLADAQVRATFFATHATDLLLDLDPSWIEVGVHPNFNPILNGDGGDYRQVLGDLLADYPRAKGARTHSLVQSTLLLDHFADAGLEYDCSQLLPYQTGLRPYRLPNGLVRIPYFWEDDVHFAYRRPFEIASIDLDPEGLSIFDFHPIHVFLNTWSAEHYAAAKPSYHLSQELVGHQNRDPSQWGTRDLLVELLVGISDARQETRTLAEVALEVL